MIIVIHEGHKGKFLVVVVLLDELLAVAFRGFYITDRDHPALRKLRGAI